MSLPYGDLHRNFQAPTLPTPEAPWTYRNYQADRQPSWGLSYCEEQGRTLRWAFEVRGLGALVLSGRSDPSGRYGRLDIGLSLFTTDELLFD